MRDFFIGWLIFQMCIIGAATISTLHKVANETYECKGIKQVLEIPVWAGAVMPIAIFLPDPKELIEYCNAIDND